MTESAKDTLSGAAQSASDTLNQAGMFRSSTS